MKAVATLLVFVLLAQPAVADRLAEASTLFDDGRFEDAARVAKDLGTADGLALAARAQLVRAAYILDGKPARKALGEALDLTRDALKLDPENVEAALQRSLALGYRSRLMGGFRAHLKGLAREARDLIDMALKQAPGDPWVQMVHGGWHAEILARGRMAQMFYNVDEGVAKAAFETALGLVRETRRIDVTLWVEVARQLLRLSVESHADRASELIEEAREAGPSTALERLALMQAGHLLRALETASPRAIERMLDACDAFRGEKWTHRCR